MKINISWEDEPLYVESIILISEMRWLKHYSKVNKTIDFSTQSQQFLLLMSVTKLLECGENYWWEIGVTEVMYSWISSVLKVIVMCVYMWFYYQTGRVSAVLLLGNSTDAYISHQYILPKSLPSA